MPTTAPSLCTDTTLTLPADSNQALGLAQFSIDFMGGSLGIPGAAAVERVELFHTDATLCGLSALALRTVAPTLLREEALEYKVDPSAIQGSGATVFGSRIAVKPEKAVVANSSAVREWDSNGTNFGYNAALGHTAGEFGHNDFYPVVLAAAQLRGLDGASVVRGMLLLDEIRDRLASVFSLKSYKIDHVVHGAIASAATFGAMVGATAEQIESAIGMTVAHSIPWRAIRAGKQLSDSKGASAAISAESAVLSTLRSMRGFRGPRDIFRNPEAIFRFFEPTTEGASRWTEVAPSPFDLTLTHSGDDFAVTGMHFKLGLYEHQSAGALQAIIDAIAKEPSLLSDASGSNIASIEILAYEPAFGIIGNPAKMDPQTRQSADHSMAYIVSTLLGKALAHRAKHGAVPTSGGSHSAAWKALMLDPYDYAKPAIFDERTRGLMSKITFKHGGSSYDARYPEGIPTSVVLTDASGSPHDSGLVLFPAGHARNETADLDDILRHKFALMADLAGDASLVDRYSAIASKSVAEIASLHDYRLGYKDDFED